MALYGLINIVYFNRHSAGHTANEIIMTYPLLIFCQYTGVALITQLRTCVIKIVIFKGGHLMW